MELTDLYHIFPSADMLVKNRDFGGWIKGISAERIWARRKGFTAGNENGCPCADEKGLKKVEKLTGRNLQKGIAGHPPKHLKKSNMSPEFETNPRFCAKIPLTHNCLPSIFIIPKSEFLSNLSKVGSHTLQNKISGFPGYPSISFIPQGLLTFGQGGDHQAVPGGMENLKPCSLENLMGLMEVNEPPYQAYLLKEDLRMFCNLPAAEVAKTFPESWIDQTRTLGLKHFVTLADMLEENSSKPLTYFRYRISTGHLEGLDNKIKVLKRQAYGFRDQVYFKLRLYFIHESIPAFAG